MRTPLRLQNSPLHPPGGGDSPLKVRHRLQNGLGPALTGALSNAKLHHDGMAVLIVGDPRSRLVGVVRGSPIVGRLCPGSSPGSQRGAVGLRTDLGRERARTENGPGPRTGSDCERTRTTSGPAPGALPGLPRPRRGAPQCPYAWRSRSAGFGRRLRCPFHTRLTTWAATSSFFMRLSSNHHCPTWAMSPTSICA